MQIGSIFLLGMMYFSCIRLMNLGILISKWAGASNDSLFVRFSALFVGFLQDLLVVMYLVFVLWIFDHFFMIFCLKDNKTKLHVKLMKAFRFMVYSMCFGVAILPVCVDFIMVQTRQMRFTFDFVWLYFKEKDDTMAEFQITNEEAFLLQMTIGTSVCLTVVFGLIGALYADLTHWSLIEICMKKKQDHHQHKTKISHSSSNRSIHTIILSLGCLIGFLWILLAIVWISVHMVTPVVALLAQNTTLTEGFRLICGLELKPTRIKTHHYVTEPLSTLLDNRTEKFEILDPHTLVRKTKGFHGPLAFNLSIDPEDPPPNVLVLVVESFRYKDSKYLSQEHSISPSLTPHFDEWAKRGIGFRNFWSSWRTSRSLVSLLFGLLPYDSITSTGTTTGRSKMKLTGLPQFMQAKGYDLLFTTGSRVDYDDWDVFLQSHGFDDRETVIDWAKMLDIAETELNLDWTEGGRLLNYWGIHDDLSYEVLLHLLRQKLTKDQRKPWFTMHYTISSHVPFDEKPDWFYRYQEHFMPNFSTLYQGQEHEKLIQDYTEMRYFSDLAFGKFMKRMEASRLLNNTIVFVVGDHGQAPENGEAIPEAHEISATRVASALIASPKMLGQYAGTLYDPPAAQYDLLNTLADLLGVPSDGFVQSGIGRSLKRQRSLEGTDGVYSNNPQRSMAIIQDHLRIRYSSMMDIIQVYDIEKDPMELDDLYGTFNASFQLKIQVLCENGRRLNDFFKQKWQHECLFSNCPPPPR